MSNARASVVSSCRASGFVTDQAFRPHLTAGASVCGAAVLVLGLVIAPPDVQVAKTKPREVQLAAFALHPTTSLPPLLDEFISGQATPVVPLLPPVVHGGAGIPNGAVITLRESPPAAPPTGSPTLAADAVGQSQLAAAIESEELSFENELAEWVTSAFMSVLPLIPEPFAGAFLFFVVVPVFAFLLLIFPPKFPEAVEAIPDPLEEDPLPAAAENKEAVEAMVEQREADIDQAGPLDELDIDTDNTTLKQPDTDTDKTTAELHTDPDPDTDTDTDTDKTTPQLDTDPDTDKTTPEQPDTETNETTPEQLDTDPTPTPTPTPAPAR